MRRKTPKLTYADSQDSVEAVELDEDEDTRCDFYFCAPEWCQKLRTRPIMIACLSWCIFIKSMLMTGFVKGNLTSLERRYGLTSLESSAIVVFHNLGVIICLIPVSHYAGTMRRLRVYSGGLFIMGVGAFLYSVPYFIGGPYKYKSSDREPVCYLEANVSLGHICELVDEKHAHHERSYRFIFWLSGFIIGVGNSGTHVLCTSYIDDNTKVTQSSLYLGIYYAFSLMGPPVGYGLTALFLQSIYVDVGSPHPGLTIADENTWVGAWWIGPQIASLLCFLAIPALFSLPKDMPGTKRIHDQRTSEAFCFTETISRTISASEFSENLLLLMRNPTFMFLSLAIMAFDLITSAMSTFGPKYLETVFGYSTGKAVEVFGISIVFLGAGGTIIGGALVYNLRMTLLQTLRFMAFVSIVLPSLVIFTFLVPCGSPGKFGWAGLTSPYQNGSVERSLNSSCNFDCQCSDNFLLFSPVCGKNGLTYFSPCFAGCTAESEDLNDYSNCSCLVGKDGDDVQYLKRGACSKNCMNTLLFIVMFCVSGLHLFILSIPTISATLRSVPQKQKTLALGFQWMIIRIFGSISGPLLTGTAFDSTCNYWSQSCTGEGNCIVYDQTRLQTLLVCLFGITQIFMSIFLLLALNFYKSDSVYEDLFPKLSSARAGILSYTSNVGSFNANNLIKEEGSVFTRLLKVAAFSLDGSWNSR